MAQQVVFGFVPRVAVVAFGGETLLPREADGTQEEQVAHAREAAGWLVDIVMKGYELAVVPGNGPQVGMLLTQVEQAAPQVPPVGLDVAAAQTQGAIGFLLQSEIRNELARRSVEREVVALLTEVEVDPDDPAFRHPGKLVGPVFNRFRARVLTEERGWTMVGDADRGFRKVVPSPRPQRILNVDTLRKLVCGGTVTIAAGGGGIPVMRRADGELVGVEAVIDENATAALLAAELKADLFVVLSGSPCVTRNPGTRKAAPIREMTVSQARALAKEGQFPPSSTGQRVEAAIRFVEAGGGSALLTDAGSVRAALTGQEGTILRPDPVSPRPRKKKGAKKGRSSGSRPAERAG
jgi:carbamate kinase